jgi:cyanophycinase-like exopeptidase
MDKQSQITPGPIALFGSGETAPGAQKIYDFLFKLAVPATQLKILETPAGFEPNSEQVAADIRKYIQHHLQNYSPEIEVIPARKKNTTNSPDNPEIVLPLLEADLIFMGPGSPSYAVRQLTNSLAWEYILARHRLGAGLAFSSAATLAVSSMALPVYEIYKVGEELHWKPGLDFFGPYGLPLVFIPHWNNQDGGVELDTSRCYMGISRFEKLVELLPEGQIIIGIDENTGMVLDFGEGVFHVVGKGNVTIINQGNQTSIPAGTKTNLTKLGKFQLTEPLAGITEKSWETALHTQDKLTRPSPPPNQVIELAEERIKARNEKNWDKADQLRAEIESLGWLVQDTPDGYQLEETSEK